MDRVWTFHLPWRRAGTLASVVAGLAFGTAPAQQPPAPAALVFDRVTVIDVTDGAVRPEQRVVIVGNRIQAAGDVRQVPLPPAAQVVDARGKYLIPGLWDMRTQAAVSNELSADLLAPLFVINGVTGIRNARERSNADTYSKRYGEVLAGTKVGPPRQLLIDFLFPDSVSAGKWSAGRAKRSEAGALQLDVVNFAVLDAARTSALSVGGGLLDYGEAFGLPSFNISAAEASDSGLTILEHIYTSGGLDTLCWAPVGSLARCQAITDHLRRNGTWFVPTIIGSFAEAHHPNVVAPHARAIYDRWRQRLTAFRTGAIPHGNWLRDSTGAKADPAPGAMAVIQQIPEFPLLAGTGGMFPLITFRRSRPLAPGFSLHAELAMYVAEGMSPLRALQAATLNPAKLLHATDSLGTVASGKLADLVLLEGNPLDDITNTTTIQAVVANGRYYDRAALDQLWADARATADAKKLGNNFP